MTQKTEVENETKTETEKPKFDPRDPRSIFDIIQDLSKPIPQKYLEVKRKGGTNIFFISWHSATKLLDYYANGWSFECKEIMNFAGKVCIVAKIGIPCTEGIIYREGTGNEDEELDSFGDAFVNSESQALRRAAAKFGLGRDLYPTRSISENEYKQAYPHLFGVAPRPGNPPPQSNNPPANNPAPATAKPENSPAAQSKLGGPTEGQLKFLSDLSLQKNISESDICDRCSDGATLVFDGLTKAQAQSAISWLKEVK